MEMVERVARTLCRAGGRPENALYYGQPTWRRYEARARDVILSMREPSPQTLTAPVTDWKIAVLN
jgi:hypothetical protein